eukprot:5068322-Prymnesium_polylepis.1
MLSIKKYAGELEQLVGTAPSIAEGARARPTSYLSSPVHLLSGDHWNGQRQHLDSRCAGSALPSRGGSRGP